MALHSVDKSGSNRSNPSPNTHDLITDNPRQAHGTNSVNFVTNTLSPDANTQIRGGNQRMVASGVVSHSIPNGTSGQITLTTTTIQHNLGATPLVYASLNDAAINNSGSYSLPLPLTTSVGNNTGGTPVTEYLAPVISLFTAADGTNFYVLSYSSGSAIAVTYRVTYYLYQQQARQA